MEKSKTNMEETATKIGRLETDVLQFMQDFRDSNHSNNDRMTKVIQGFVDTLKAEKEALATLRSDLRKENSDLASSLEAKFEKLREDLAMENEVMDLLASKTTKIQLLKTHLKNTTAVLSSAVSQTQAVRNCVTKIDTYICRMVEEDNPVLTPYLCGHITNKLHPVLLLLSKIHGVSEYVAIPKQEGYEKTKDESNNDNEHEKVEEKKKEKEKEDENDNVSDVSKEDQGDGSKKATESPIQQPKFSTVTNVKKPGTEDSGDDIQKPKSDWFEKMNIGDTTTGPSKRKKKKIGEDDVDEEVEISEAAKLARAAREKELDDLLRISRKLDVEDAAKHEAAVELKTRRSLFPDWDYETMKEEAITRQFRTGCSRIALTTSEIK
ncbi:hypothetical protein L2E82_48886 [Cichorium intybus]|uniref:Uncharacterized protein n=1 Tax=Cichorium intybus TaxID=13427 RepID=A0ACB8YZE4_CICIN|nr:hypothetical protein L2E82_48886 [Cichorium intybus]